MTTTTLNVKDPATNEVMDFVCEGDSTLHAMKEARKEGYVVLGAKPVNPGTSFHVGQ